MTLEKMSPADGAAGPRKFGKVDTPKHSSAQRRRQVAPREECRAGFRHSNQAAFRRAVRDAIRRSALSRGEQAVTVALANLWFHHKPKGEMHPGREKIARKALVSIKTVTRTMAKLREAGCLVALSHENGGRTATRYRLRPLQLMVFCGAQLPDWVEDELALVAAGNVPLSDVEMSRFTGDKMSHGIYTVAKRHSRPSKTQVAAPLRVVGGRHA